MTVLRLISAALAAALVSAHANAEDMTIVSYGGAYSASQDQAYHQPYLRENPGLNIINEASSSVSVERLRAMQEAGEVSWDVVDMVAADVIRACNEGLIRKIDIDALVQPAPDGTPASEDYGGLLISPCFVPTIVYSTTFGYRTDKIGDQPPSEICDVFDVQAYPGRRALERRPINNLEWALLCDGVARDEVYEVLATDAGIERALAKLETIKNHVVWWTSGSETPALLARGEVVMGSTYNGRLFKLIEEDKAPVAMLWDAQVFDLEGWVIPAGLPPQREARALDFIRFATTTQRLADQTRFISYGPARASSAPMVGTHANLGIEMAPHMPNAPANAINTFLYNYQFWAKNRDRIDLRFNAWLEKLGS